MGAVSARAVAANARACACGSPSACDERLGVHALLAGVVVGAHDQLVRPRGETGRGPLEGIRNEYANRIATWEQWNDLSVRAHGEAGQTISAGASHT
jgi:hypothetical protein